MITHSTEPAPSPWSLNVAVRLRFIKVKIQTESKSWDSQEEGREHREQPKRSASTLMALCFQQTSMVLAALAAI